MHLVLLQILEHTSGSAHDQQTLGMLLSAIGHFHSEASDVDFETLLSLLDQISAGALTYTAETPQQIVTILCSIKVTRVANTRTQAWLAFQHPSVEMQSENPYHDLIYKHKSSIKSSDEHMVKMLAMKPQHAITLLVGIF